MAAAALDLCLASEVADDLGVTVSDRIQRAVTAASEAIAAYCGRTFEYAEEIVEYPESAGRPLLLLARSPIVSIDTITEWGGEVPASEYECTGSGALVGFVLRKAGRWVPTQRQALGSVSDQVDGSYGQSDLIVATYEGGYVTPGQNYLDPDTYPTVTLPESVREAAIQTACMLFRVKGADPNIQSESIGDWSASYFSSKTEESTIPAYARALLAPYRLAWT